MTIAMDRHESHFQNTSSSKQLDEQQYLDDLLALLQDSTLPPLYDNNSAIASSQTNILLSNTQQANTSLDVTRKIQIIEESLEDLVLEGRKKFGMLSTPSTVSPSLSPRWHPIAPLSIAPSTPLIVSSTGSTPLLQTNTSKEQVPPLSLDNSPPSATPPMSTTQQSFQQSSSCPQQLLETVTNKYQQFIQKYEPAHQTNAQEAETTNYVQAMYQWAYSGNTTKNLRETIRAASALAPPAVYNTAPPRTRHRKGKKEQHTDEGSSSDAAMMKRAARRNSTGNIMDALHAPNSSSSSSSISTTTTGTTTTLPTVLPQTTPFISVVPPPQTSIASSSSQVPQQPYTHLGLELFAQGGANAARALAALQKMKKQYSFTEVTSQSLKHKADKDRKRKEAKRRKHSLESDSPLSEESIESFSSGSSSNMMNQNSSTISISTEESYPSPQQPIMTQPFFNTANIVPTETNNSLIVPQQQLQQQQLQQATTDPITSLFGGFFYGNQPKSKKSKDYEAYMSNWKI